MRTITMTLAGLATLLTVAAAPAPAAFCYDLDVNVNGDQVVDEEDCVEAPTGPELGLR